MTHASVFSGIGGPEVAATMLGWKNLFHCEINPFGKRVLDYWYPNAESYDDITKTDFTKWRGRVDVLTGGFPCQPFSYAGRRKGADDDRYLWPHMFRCIDEIRPTWVVAENVAGITTMVEQGKVSEVASQATLFGEGDTLHRYQLRETFTLERICTDLESHGYSVQPILIPACAVGAPHRRDRVFIIGHLTDIAQNTERIRREELGDIRIRWRWNFGTGSDARAQSERLHEVGQGRWRYDERGEFDFTVSPVHRGNDGIPFNVDCLTLSFGKWRTEALKAYGNAIVPQVMYEIFRAIEKVEQ